MAMKIVATSPLTLIVGLLVSESFCEMMNSPRTITALASFCDLSPVMAVKPYDGVMAVVELTSFDNPRNIRTSTAGNLTPRPLMRAKPPK
jgi:hypothetical protein